MAQKGITTSLDFTAILAARGKAPVPPKVPKKVPEKVTIGAKALKKGGYFVKAPLPDLGLRAIRAGCRCP